HSVARRYDLMNDLMSFGLHRAWKNALVIAVNPPKRLPFSAIDIAGGTGDIAFRIIDAGGAQTRVTVCDINPDMLAVGRGRATLNRIVIWSNPSAASPSRKRLLPCCAR